MKGTSEDEFEGRHDLVRKRAIMIALNRMLIVIIVVWMIGMMVTLVILGIQGESDRERLVDCTTPGGECFERSQDRTGVAVAQLNHVIQLAAACADRPGVDTYADIEACVLDGLEEVR